MLLSCSLQVNATCQPVIISEPLCYTKGRSPPELHSPSLAIRHETNDALPPPLRFPTESQPAQAARRVLRETTCAVLFDTLGVPAICAVDQVGDAAGVGGDGVWAESERFLVESSQAVLALFSHRQVSGLVVNIGFRATSIVPGGNRRKHL